MKSVLVIFNGIKFPYYLIEFTLSQAKQNKAFVHALFITAKNEIREGYVYPSDLKATEEITAIQDGKQDDLKIINDQMKLVIDMAGYESVSCTTELITDCSLDEILEIIKKFDVIYIDAVTDNDTSMLRNTRFSAKDLIKQAPDKIKQISEDTDIN